MTRLKKATTKSRNDSEHTLSHSLTHSLSFPFLIGGGVIKILQNPQIGSAFQITKVLCRDVNKPRDFELPEHVTYTEDWKEAIKDVDMVVELIGGTTLAKDAVYTALKSGVHVVTANKALVAEHMQEIEDILAETDNKAKLGYEAAVGGGIPIIRSLQTSVVSADQVNEVAGILNGTTNFMLSKMASESASYDDVLKEAQALGFAEAEPSADVEGYDARAKISILARLGLGVRIPALDIPCAGITRLTVDDFDYATTLNSTIKLIATVRRVPSAKDSKQTTVQAFVAPAIVPLSGIIGNVNGATNVVQIGSESLGSSHLLGQGAGRFPTANSVVADMVAIQNQTNAHTAFPVEADTDFIFDEDYESPFYIRLNVKDGTGIISDIGRICAENGISIDSILQNPITDSNNVPFVITTDSCRRSAVKKLCHSTRQQPWCLEDPLVMPLLPEPKEEE